MYFILSKILLFLIVPFYWVVLLLLIALISKDTKRKQCFLITAVVVLYLFSAPLFLKLFANTWDVRSSPPKTMKPYSCVIVLGGFSSTGGEDGGHFSGAADRFIQGAKLLTTKKAAHILISGGNGNLVPGEYREAAWTRLQLQKLNIPDSLILVENNSKNTFENARFSKNLLQKAHLQPPYLLVTSAFHMRRSLMIFKKAGLSVVAYPSNFISDPEIIFSDIIPGPDTLANWSLYTKELVGYVVNYFK